MDSPALAGICTPATYPLLAELAALWNDQDGSPLRIDVGGGVDVARRIAAGEAFDWVVLAGSAIDRLASAGHAAAASKADVARCDVAIAIPEGARPPDIGSESALRQTLLEAPGIGYSTGPSGAALVALLERWGLAETLRPRLVQAPPGVPVGSLLTRGMAAIGFQQRSELIHLNGITVLGGMPAGLDILTTFCAARCATSTRAREVQMLFDFLRSPGTEAAKRRHGMIPAPSGRSSGNLTTIGF